MKRSGFLFLVCLLSIASLAQKKVHISIDDAPNTRLYKHLGYKSVLLDKLDSLQVPVSVFLNEGKIYQHDSVVANFALLERWIQRSYTELGNHTFSHSRSSKAGPNAYAADVKKGEAITKELVKYYDKELKYFRFTFNDLGKDSLQQAQIAHLLDSMNYIITPFTIESSDYMFNDLYRHYLREGNKLKADSIGMAYVEKTLDYFIHFEQVATDQYGRDVNQIYLCHDSHLNADYLDVIIKKLRDRGYEFITLEETLKDPVYSQTNHYHKHWGVSWFYRWMKDHKERIKLMKQEPDLMEYFKVFQELQKKK